MSRSMRRYEHKLTEEESWGILQKADYGILSSVSGNGQPYGVPLNHCLIEGDIYFHSATEGHKIDNVRIHPEVSFSVVGETKIVPEKFTTLYESVITFGKAKEVFTREKQTALRALMKKFSPDLDPEKVSCLTEELTGVCVFKISIEKNNWKVQSLIQYPHPDLSPLFCRPVWLKCQIKIVPPRAFPYIISGE